MICSVCIATYMRPHLLEKLLKSLMNQNLPENFEMEIIIVDNGPNSLGRNIYEKFASNCKYHIYYFTQRIKNISLTRNLAVQKASGEYLLFIDDDEYADPNWISELMKTMKKYNADAVFGIVLSYFEEGTPDWIKKIYLYNRNINKTGSIPSSTRTGNCIVKAEILKNIPGPFDLKYGISGGSDTKLFGNLKSEGAKFINCREAITFEYVPQKRISQRWMIKRAFRGGNDYSRTDLELTVGNKKYLKIIKHLIISTTYILVSMVLSLIFLPNKFLGMHWKLKMFANIGKLWAVLGIHPKEYF